MLCTVCNIRRGLLEKIENVLFYETVTKIEDFWMEFGCSHLNGDLQSSAEHFGGDG
jgi:hypothetical protein